LDRAANASADHPLRGVGKNEMSLMTPVAVRLTVRAISVVLGKTNVRIAVEAPATPDSRTGNVINYARLRGPRGNACIERRSAGRAFHQRELKFGSRDLMMESAPAGPGHALVRKYDGRDAPAGHQNTPSRR
jgi:hypothetical protein